MVLVGTAAHKLSRVISKDKVTSFVRAPFTELEGKGGPAEFEERARGTGARRAIGELLICPYCLGLWVVAAFAVGLLVAPRLTRVIASVFSALTISDFLQIAYKAAEEKGLGWWPGQAAAEAAIAASQRAASPRPSSFHAGIAAAVSARRASASSPMRTASSSERQSSIHASASAALTSAWNCSAQARDPSLKACSRPRCARGPAPAAAARTRSCATGRR